MTGTKTSRRATWISIVGAILCLLMLVTPALAGDGGGGNVLPPTAAPKGYSLAEAAAATAYFNAGPRTPDTLPANFPFRILYTPDGGDNTFPQVKPGTMFYVPVFWDDDTEPPAPTGDPFPLPDVNDPQAVSDYWFDPAQLGAELTIVVDGNVTPMGPGYAAGAETPELPTGGNNYTVVAAFLTPMSKGTHTVAITARMSGDLILEAYGGVLEWPPITYTVTVG